MPDEAFAVASVVPDVDYTTKAYSPVFRYPYGPAAAAVAAAPLARDGSRRVRYVNPLTGGTAMELIDCYLVQLDPGMITLPYRTNASSVCCVVEGEGESQVGDKTVHGASATSSRCRKAIGSCTRCTGGTARLFVVSDRDVFARLGLLKEEYGNLAA